MIDNSIVCRAFRRHFLYCLQDGGVLKKNSLRISKLCWQKVGKETKKHTKKVKRLMGNGWPVNTDKERLVEKGCCYG